MGGNASRWDLDIDIMDKEQIQQGKENLYGEMIGRLELIISELKRKLKSEKDIYRRKQFHDRIKASKAKIERYKELTEA